MMGVLKKAFLWGDVAFFLVLAAFVLSRAQWTMRSCIGLGLAAVGFGLWTMARVQLGEAFSIRAQARALVTTGLYSRFRHPIYLFGFFAYLGVLLIWGKWILLACFVLVYGIEVFRLKKEERVLEEAFGEDYRRYKARTWI